MKCAHCGNEVESHESGLCDSCETQHRYDTIEGRFDRDDWNSIADALNTLAEIDEGENTDYDVLIRLRDEILAIPGVH